MDARKLTVMDSLYDGAVQAVREGRDYVAEAESPEDMLKLAAAAAAVLAALGIIDSKKEWELVLKALYEQAEAEGITRFEMQDYGSTVHRLRRELDEIAEGIL